MDLHRQQRGDHGDGDEEGQEEEGQADVAVREQDGHRHDGPEFTDGAHGQDRRPDRRAQHPGVAQNGQQRPESRGGQAERHHDRVEDQVRRVQGDADGKGEDHRRGPGPCRQPQVTLPHDRQVELRAGQEHEVGEAEIGQRRHDRVGMRQREDVRPDEDPEEDLDHHLGHRQVAAGSLRDDGCQNCRHADQDQGGNGVFDHASSARLPWHPSAAPGRPRYVAAASRAGDRWRRSGLTAPSPWGSMAPPESRWGSVMGLLPFVHTRASSDQ